MTDSRHATQNKARGAHVDPESDLSHLDGGAVFLFASFDMVNSTEFKNHEPRWPFVLHQFYVHVVDEIKKVCPRFNVWKYIGDEVVFWRHVDAGDDLAALVKAMQQALLHVMDKLEKLESEHHIRTKNLISVKGTLWSAASEFVADTGIAGGLTRKPSHPNRIIRENHIIAIGSNKAHETVLFDFIGPEIDIGFRISKHAHRGFLLLSAELTYLILQQSRSTDEIDKHLRVISYDKLKGVWGGRSYPIIWYSDDWDNVKPRFYYDERLENPLIERLFHEQYDHVSVIPKVLAETNRLEMSKATYDLWQQSPPHRPS